MKRKIKKSCKNLLWLWMVLILASCKKDTAPSEKQHDDVSLGSYVFETDWQYYMCNNINAKAKIQETENGCVFIHKGYLYRYEQGGSIMPLCANANCLHDQETDPEKQKECCAYLDYARTGDSFDRESAALMKYKDELFVCYDRTDHDPDTGDMCLMKIALDGS